MGIPKKALSKGNNFQLIKRIDDGSHETWLASVQEDGSIKTGYYKKLDSKYPALLAQISVGASVLSRLAIGDRAAEERLVFENGKLVGSLSFALENFQPFLFAGKPIPTNAVEKEKVVPSTETLIDEEFMELLWVCFILMNNDFHAGNGSVRAFIDYDMFYYPFTYFMKGGREKILAPSTTVKFSNRNYLAFPCLGGSGGDEPYHWPTFTHPGQESIEPHAPEKVQKPILSAILPSLLPKVYADPTQFARLASETRAQEQKLAAALKMLVTFDPVVAEARLTEQFGDMTLDYTSLSPQIREKYEKAFPQLCNKKTDKETFVSFMMKLNQLHYDAAYRLVVLDMGCEDNGYGLKLPATYAALHSKPSHYKKIVAWIEKENKTTHADAANECKYNLEAVEQRYHQIWRDAFAPKLKEILTESYGVINKLLNTATNGVQVKKLVSKATTDEHLTEAVDIFGVIPELALDAKSILIDLPITSLEPSVRQGLVLVMEYTRELHTAINTYYQKKRVDLTQADNIAFVKKLYELDDKYTSNALNYLGHTTDDATEFRRIAKELMASAVQMKFDRHLLAIDEPMDSAYAAVPRKEQSLTDPELIKEFNLSLFRWADGLDKDDFELRVNNIIDKNYTPYLSLVLWRQRAEPVKQYLMTSSLESNSKRLAYILGTGATDDGALNSALIKEFTEPVLQKYYIPSILNAYRQDKFNIDGSFTKAAVHYAKTDLQFAHLFVKVDRPKLTPHDITKIYEEMYQWVDDNSERFATLRKKAVTEYENARYKGVFFGSKGRKEEIDDYVSQKYSPGKIFALTLKNGEVTSDLSKRMFNGVVAEISRDVHKKQGLQLLLQCTEDERRTLQQQARTHTVTTHNAHDSVHVLPVVALRSNADDLEPFSLYMGT